MDQEMQKYQDGLENILEKYGRDLVKQYQEGKGEPIIGRDDEIREITRILSRKTKKKKERNRKTRTKTIKGRK